MKTTFIFSGCESYSIEVLSSVLKKAGHQTTLVFDSGLFDDKQYFNIPILKTIFRKNILKEIKKTNPDIIAFSLKTDFFKTFRFIPSIFVYALEVMISIKNKHLQGANYIKYYLHHIRKRFI